MLETCCMTPGILHRQGPPYSGQGLLPVVLHIGQGIGLWVLHTALRLVLKQQNDVLL